jgi:hypothetical protein
MRPIRSFGHGSRNAAIAGVRVAVVANDPYLAQNGGTGERQTMTYASRVLGIGLVAAAMCCTASFAQTASAPGSVATPRSALVPVVGRRVADAEGAVIGRIWDVLVNDRGAPEAAVVEYGGVLGVGRRRVAVAWSALRFPRGDVHQPVPLHLTSRQLGALPAYRYGAAHATIGQP